MTKTPKPDSMTDTITAKLTAALSPVHIEVQNDSELHRGHAGYSDGESHFSVLIVSSAFAGKNRVARQRLVYSALKGEMKGAIHALALKTLSPDEWTD